MKTKVHTSHFQHALILCLMSTLTFVKQQQVDGFCECVWLCQLTPTSFEYLVASSISNGGRERDFSTCELYPRTFLDTI